MNKLTISLLAALVTGSLTMSAEAKVCPFTDNFYIESTYPVFVLGASVKDNLAYEQVSANYFRLGCRDPKSASGGDLYIEIGVNSNIKCSMILHDGPFVMNPTITDIYCGGADGKLHFMGMDHPFGSYNYTLKFAG